MSKPKRIVVSFTMTPESKATLERIAEADHRNMSSQIEWLIKEDLRRRGPKFSQTIGVDYATAEPLPPAEPQMTVEQEIAKYLAIATESGNFWHGICQWAEDTGHWSTSDFTPNDPEGARYRQQAWVGMMCNALGTTEAHLEPRPLDVPKAIRYIRSKNAADILATLKKPQETAQ